jgi:hypothetical protein
MDAISDLLSHRSDLIGGTITFWPSFPPLPPLVAEITDIKRVTHDGTDYVDGVVETTLYESVVEGGPIHLQKDFAFELNPSRPVIVNVGPGLWSIAVPMGESGQGVAVLQSAPRRL